MSYPSLSGGDLKSAPGMRWRAPYACDPGQTRGRKVIEDSSPTRSDFQRDRDRIIHSTAFRRLKHKTQVFVSPDGDHYRTRLTHTIEVSQIARSLARALGLDEDLAETLALAHDLGHPPYGHVGEDALDICMKPYGGFDHNAQTLRLVTRLERRYADFDGLNLTWETLEGLVKHNGPLFQADGTPTLKHLDRGIPLAITEFDKLWPLELSSFASAEAQAAAIADDIAYNAHDIDDGVAAGLFALDALKDVPFLRDILAEVEARHPGLDDARRRHELVRRVITRAVEDVIIESLRRLGLLNPQGAGDIRAASQPMIVFSETLSRADRDIKGFLYPNMYRHRLVVPAREKAAQLVIDLFDRLLGDPLLLPENWRADIDKLTQGQIARRICDYIAGMTDLYAEREWARVGRV
ncbi:MAG: deoxyguanosinetriphosphate triphosphohydrolase [Bosea sp. (in: a-proteobacteria)]